MAPDVVPDEEVEHRQVKKRQQQAFLAGEGLQRPAVAADTEREQARRRHGQLVAVEQHVHQHVDDERVERVQEEVRRDVGAVVHPEAAVLEEERELQQRLAEPGSDVSEHLPGAGRELVRVQEDLEIQRGPEITGAKTSECGVDQHEQEPENRPMNS